MECNLKTLIENERVITILPQYKYPVTLVSEVKFKPQNNSKESK